LLVLSVLGGYGYWALTKPLPLLMPAQASQQILIPAAGSKLAWPASQAAVGILGTDVLETHGNQTPAPIASVAKVITCLVVLDKKPLKAGQTGPVITLTPADVALYKNTMAQDGSLVSVVAGEQITQYQMLQAIMLPSANNMADSLAIWAFGSLANYTTTANAFLAEHGLSETKVGVDASGLSPTTTSTATDLVKLGELAMQEPVLAEVVGQSTATGIPQTAFVKNVNSLLGTANIVGIKTGNTEQAGGVFLSASRLIIENKPTIIVTAVVGSPTLFVALKDSLTLVKSAQTNFEVVTVVDKYQEVGRYAVPWGGSIATITEEEAGVSTWNGSKYSTQVNLRPVKVGSTAAGSIPITNQPPVKVRLAYKAAPPSAWWRLSHPISK